MSQNQPMAADAIMGLMRETLVGNFPDTSTGEIIEYRNIQLEFQDQKTKEIIIKKATLPKELWPNQTQYDKLIGKYVMFPVTENIQGKDKNVIKKRISGDPVVLNAA